MVTEHALNRTPMACDGRGGYPVPARCGHSERRSPAPEPEGTVEVAERGERPMSGGLARLMHDVRSPISSIVALAQLMLSESSLTPRQRRGLDAISRSGEHILSLLNDIADLERAGARRLALNPTSCDLHSLIDDVAEVFRVCSEAKGVRLSVNRGDGVPRYVVLDEMRLCRVLHNLLGNAVKLTPSGGVALRVDAERLAPGVVSLAVAVADTGPGIAAEDLEGILQPFEQADAGRQAGEGVGLGLAISRELVRLMGGDIRVTSSVGAGSVFSFGIVVEEAASGAAPGGAPYERTC